MTIEVLQVDEITAGSPVSLTAPATADCLVLCQHNNESSAAALSAASWNAVALSLVASEVIFFDASSVWILPAPDHGTYNLAWTGNKDTLWAVWLRGVRQVSPVRAAATASVAATNNTISVTVGSSEGDLVLYLLSSNSGDAPTASGLTELDQSVAPFGAIGYEAGASPSVAGGWGFPSDQHMTEIAVSLIPAPQGAVMWFF